MKKVLRRAISLMLASAMLCTGIVFADVTSIMAAGITAEAAGWNETAYVEWLPVNGAMSYKVYVKPTGGEYKEIDNELIREYDTYFRADAVGISQGTYSIKVEAYSDVDGNGNVVDTFESEDIRVQAYDRAGFAFSSGAFEKGAGLGGYKADGTPKDNAQIIYITDENKNTIQWDVVTDSEGNTTKGTGIGEIIKLFEKGYETRPYIFRFVGEIAPPYSEAKFSLDITDEQFHTGFESKKGEAGDRVLDVKDNMKNVSSGGITFEGIGNDTILHFNFTLSSAKNIEIRNFGFKDMTTSGEDAVSVSNNTTDYWVHHNDFFYGGQGNDADQAKGDGSVDVKNAPDMGTISYNHFWDNGKSCLEGLGESEDYHVTYHHNWFDHSDSRHPRIRGGSTHIYNNYYDGNAKYGVGMTSGGSAFVENNYFRNVNDIMMISNQGTDAQGTGTFSGEPGGIIKVYNNIYAGSYRYIEGTVKAEDGSKQYERNADGYTVDSREETLPDTLKCISGGTSYNNFDTTMDIGVNQSDIDDVKDIPAIVMAEAGRCDSGSFVYEFNDSVDDADYGVNAALTAALETYRNGIVLIGGNVSGNADTDAAKTSATGIDGNTLYQTTAVNRQIKAQALPKQTQEEGNKSTNGELIITDLILNPALIEAGTFDHNVEGMGTNGAFDIIATTEKTVTVDSKCIALGGAGSMQHRAVSVTVVGPATLYVKANSSGSDTRTLMIVDENGNEVGTLPAPDGGEIKLPVAGKYYIYSKSKGINIKSLKAVHSEETNPPTEEYMWGDFNHDMNLDASDSANVLQHVLRSTYIPEDIEVLNYLDVDKSGEISSGDSAMILQKVLMSTYKFSVEE